MPGNDSGNGDDRLFDPDEAKRRAEEGMERAKRAARVQFWKTSADWWLAQQTPGAEVVADDLVRDVGLPDTGPARNNVIGAWFSAQSKAGRLTFAGRLRKSKRAVGHQNLQRVWIVGDGRLP